MPETAYAWAPITKSEKQDDGTLIVYGPAASPDLDRDQQRLNPQWLDQAMPAWFAQGANVREQHDGKRAVGVGVGLSKTEGELHMLAARIVDPIAVAKVEHGVLKGFSVGIKGPKVAMGKADAPGGEIVGGDIIEVSVVDRPCNPTTLFEIAKADDANGSLTVVENAAVTEKTEAEAFGLPQELYDRLATPVKDALNSLASGGATIHTEIPKTDTPEASTGLTPVVVNVTVNGRPPSEEELLNGLAKADLSAAGRRKTAASGAAMSDGSYPIQNKNDLRKAIRAVGRGGADHDKIRAHIVKRAKALGLSDMIPDNWKADGSMTTKVDEDTITKAEEILRVVRALAPSLAKADDGSGEDESQDIAGAENAIAVIARLIIAEAESLAQGQLNEATDISLLLDAVRSLTWFKSREEQEESGASDAALTLADQPDITKSEEAPGTPPAPDSAPENPDAQRAPDTLTKADVAELVKAAVAEAEAAAKEREEVLAADLVKAQQAIEEFRTKPVPGGPALTRTADQQAQSRTRDADRMRIEAKLLLAKADAAVDPTLRRGYTDRANELLEKADA